MVGAKFIVRGIEVSLLETAQRVSSDPELIETQIRDRASEVVRAYRHSWDVYSELIQNSVDAINRRYRILNDPDFYLYGEIRERFPDFESDMSYTGRIEIKVDVRDREIEIRDNGVGIVREDIEEFLLPEGTDKSMGQEYGFKGYGLTYVAFISKKFYLASQPFVPASSQAHEFSLRGLFDWLTSDNGEVPFPSEPIPDTVPIEDDFDDEWSTIVKVKLFDDYSTRFPAVSSAEQAIELTDSERRLEGFKYILRTRTAIGNTRVLFSTAPIVPITVTLSVIFPDGSTVEDTTVPYQYCHPREHREIAADAYEFADYVERLHRAGFTRNFRGLYHTVKDETVGERRPIECDYALGVISSRRLSNIEAELGLDEFETGDVGISYGVYLAIDGMPTGLRIDDWDTKGAFLKRYFVVVDASLDVSDQLDPGRKGISRYYAQKISDRAIELLNSSTVGSSDPLARYAARYLDHGRGREDGGLPTQDFQERLIQVRDEGTQQEEANPELLNKLRAVSSLTFFPTDEQEVIALFYELLTEEFIKGYRTLYLGGSRAAYDAAFEYEIDCVEDNIHPEDALGIGQVLVENVKGRGRTTYVHSDHYAGRTYLPQLCVDFKRNIGGFLDEVIQRSSSSSKHPQMIDLLITWDSEIPASISSTAYTIDLLPDNRRVFHSTTHRLGLIREYSTEIWCIVLKEVLNRISVE